MNTTKALSHSFQLTNEMTLNILPTRRFQSEKKVLWEIYVVGFSAEIQTVFQ